MRLSRFLSFLSSRYLDIGERDIQLIIEDALSHTKQDYTIEGVDIVKHSTDDKRAALIILAKRKRNR
jgi:hypothetical protein